MGQLGEPQNWRGEEARAKMSRMKDLPSARSRALRFLVLAPLIGGALGAAASLFIVFYISATNANELRGDPGGWFFMFLIVWGGLGVAVGSVVGVIGAIMIALSGKA